MNRKNILVITCFVLSAILLTLIQPPFDFSFLAWIALIPFVFGCLISEKTWRTIIFAYLVSLIYWLGNLYWLEPSTFLGWFMFCLYIAVYWPVIAVCLRYCPQRKMPLWLILPVLIVGAEAFQGVCFRGFDWRYLGHSQYANITIIQIADIFGAAGVSFLVAMVNGAIIDLLIWLAPPILWRGSSFPRKRESRVVGIVFTFCVLIAAIFYGRYRISQTPAYLADGPKIGVVQSNVLVSAGANSEPIETIFLDMLVSSRDCLQTAEPLLIIWPETMVEAVLDDSYLKLASDDDSAKLFHNTLSRHCSEGVYLLVGTFAGDAEVAGDEIALKTNYNSAFLYEPNQTGKRQRYDKIHLVPFGEYIPFKDALPFLHKFLLKLTPYDYDYTLNPGREYTVFKIRDEEKTYRFGVMICYEDTVPKIARKLTYNGDKRIDWLVNISNDGWFVSEKNGRVKPSVELVQHTAICVFRAVENRVPVMRSVNTGISCFIDSLGRIHNGYISGNIAKRPFDRTGQGGWLADEVLIDKRITVFSQTGQNLEIACGVCLIFIAFMSIYKIRKQNLK